MLLYINKSLIVLSCCLHLLFAWVQRYDGPAESDDNAAAIVVDSAGYIYVTGGSTGVEPAYDTDYATIKYHPGGYACWIVRYEGTAQVHDIANAIAVDQFGSVYVGGMSMGLGGSFVYATVKYNSDGDEKWVVRYSGNEDYSYDVLTAIAVDNSCNVYVTGRCEYSPSNNNYTTIKYDSLGVEQWVAIYDGLVGHTDVARAIAVDDTGNVYVTGYSWGQNTQYDMATIKYNPSGNEEWVRRYNGEANGYDAAYDLAMDNSGYICVVGYCQALGSGSDIVTIKYDSSGNTEWIQQYNGPANATDNARALAIDEHNNVYVGGYTINQSTYKDFCTIKYDSLGIEKWVSFYNGSANGQDSITDIAVDLFGNIYVTGSSNQSGNSADYTTIGYDSLGNEEMVVHYNGPASDQDVATAIATDQSGYICVTGYSYDGYMYGMNDYATMRITPTGIFEQNLVMVPKVTQYSSTIFSGSIILPQHISYKIFDITGRQIHTIDPAPGIYFIEVDGEIRQKVVKIR